MGHMEFSPHLMIGNPHPAHLSINKDWDEALGGIPQPHPALVPSLLFDNVWQVHDYQVKQHLLLSSLEVSSIEFLKFLIRSILRDIHSN